MRALVTIVAALAFATACGDNHKQQPSPDDAGIDAGADAAVDAPPTSELKPCLDRTDALPRPPTGALPCDLLPPEFGQ